MTEIRWCLVPSQFLRFAAVGAVALLISGCASKAPVPVKGIVLRPDGTPLTNCYIAFVDIDQDQSGDGVLDEEGKFDIWPDSKTQGLRPGKYLVTVAYFKDEGLPKRYESLKESGWEVTVGRQGATDIVLRMTE